MSAATTYLWNDGALEPRDDCDVLPASIEVADSWLVTDGTVLALDLHRSRWGTSIPRGRYLQLDPGAFWDAALATIPREGAWFPRFELRTQLFGDKTLADVAKARGKTVAGLVAALVADEKKELQAAVSSGRITQAQADEMLANAEARFTDLVNGTRPDGGRHHRFADA